MFPIGTSNHGRLIIKATSAAPEGRRVGMDRVVLMCVLFMASSAVGLKITPVSEADLNRLVLEQLKHPVKRTAEVKHSCQPSCPYGWVQFDGRCFSYYGYSLDWAAAEAYCINLGGNLVSIHSENEYQVVKALIRAYDPSEKETWIGLSNCQKKNSWVWSDGNRYRYSKWNSKEPNHNGGECCAHINHGSQKDWNDIPCNKVYAFVCVRRL